MISLKDRLGDRKEVRLGDIVETYSGGTPNSSESKYYNGEINFIGSGEIGLLKTQKRISKEALNVSSAKLVETGDLLYALYGATSGKVAISAIDGAINQAVLCIKPEESKINKIYLFQLLRFNKNKILEKYLQGGQGNLSSAIIKNLKFNIIDINIQSQVANFLSSIDILIEKQEEYINQLEEQKQGYMQKIFAQELRFKGFNEEWNLSKLNNLIDVKSSIITDKELKKEGMYKVYGASGVQGYLDNYMFSKETVAIVKDGSGVGRIFLCKEKSSVIGTLNYFNNKNINVKFLYYILNIVDILKHKVGSTIPHIYFRDYGIEKIYVPPLEEQNKIASLLSSMDKLIELNEKKLEQLKLKKKYYLNEIFR